MTDLSQRYGQIEEERLAALLRYDVLDSAAEEPFSDLAQLASFICECPIALITLIDRQRAWFKAAVGIDITEIPRDMAFCDRVVAEHRPLVLDDTTQHEVFRHNPLVVQAPYARFYAGAPLLTGDGHALGTLCVIDQQPRHLESRQLDALKMLSGQVISQLELRRHLHLALNVSETLQRHV